MAAAPMRPGFRTITPYLLVRDCPRLLAFVAEAFGAVETLRQARPDGSVMHAEVRIGDSMVMMGEASGAFAPMPAAVYLYVPDCDAVAARAIATGGECIFPTTTMPSGERYAGVKDPCGNVWWIATHVEDVAPDEEARRWAAYRG